MSYRSEGGLKYSIQLQIQALVEPFKGQGLECRESGVKLWVIEQRV
jgi:hypothetical protein